LSSEKAPLTVRLEPCYWAHRQTPIRDHLKVSHYHVFDKRRPNHSPGLTLLWAM
jgi:hypothetical protein